jgi:uncharacterized protein YifE (UPF0438 family)
MKTYSIDRLPECVQSSLATDPWPQTIARIDSGETEPKTEPAELFAVTTQARQAFETANKREAMMVAAYFAKLFGTARVYSSEMTPAGTRYARQLTTIR